MPDTFTLDPAKTRVFLAEALRRHGEQNLGGQGACILNPGADPDDCTAHPHESNGEGWTLAPGWDHHSDAMFADQLNEVENLVYYAKMDGAITGPPGADVDLMIDSGHDPSSDWMCQVRVSFHPGARFALCSPYRTEYRKLGWTDGPAPKGKGAASAWAVLTEVVAVANRIVAGFLESGGTLPAGEA